MVKTEQEISRPIVVLTKEAILSAEDLPRELVDVPEWGGSVWVQALNGRQRAAWQEASFVQRGKNSSVNFANTTVMLVALSVVDDAGARLFTDAEIRDLRNKSSSALERISEVAMRLSGIGDDEIEDMAGNSNGIRSGDFATD